MSFHAVWIEIPVKDINRAADFYGILFEKKVEVHDDGVRRIGMLTDVEENGVGASLTETENFEPSDKGIFVYVQGGADLNGMLSHVEPAGGTVMTQKTSMGDAGYYATFQDTEGNVLALHSMN